MTVLSTILRASVPYLADPLRRAPRNDPDFADATWLAGVAPGTLLRSTEISPVGLHSRINPATSHRISYVTTDSRGRSLTATGAVMRSRIPWAGNGPRPTVAFAPSTQGVAARCDPSFSCTVGFAVRTRPLDAIASYEQPVISLLIAAGADVVLSDYPRDPEDHVMFYGDHFSAARALADAVRAAREVGVDSRVLGLWGFSQGGGAAAGWLEAPEYAPELQPVAAVVGAPPVHLPEVLGHLEGSFVAPLALYAVAGLAAWDEEIAEELYSRLSPTGAAAVEQARGTCAVGTVLQRPWATTRDWTSSGVTMSELIDELPATRQRLAELELGTRPPLSIPTRLWAGRDDNVVPYRGVARLARSWGVELDTRRPPRVGVSHSLPYFLHAPWDVRWLMAHLNG
ncbi:lipase family protein [Corynebacterium auris]|uniref:lipase family protein n=1 Tax=Corynebacterium auris TaxID=44750 RepID=UPI0025B615B9|nr:lipase family protein [Corynebacterium auris]WJY68032.1 putative inactive lipase [Corynebacterium auris]